jgi:hypothetical protein
MGTVLLTLPRISAKIDALRGHLRRLKELLDFGGFQNRSRLLNAHNGTKRVCALSLAIRRAALELAGDETGLGEFRRMRGVVFGANH